MSIELSVIIPFCNEWPMITFTIRSVAEALLGQDIEFEILAVDNWCEEVESQNRVPDRGHDHKIDPDDKSLDYGMYESDPPGVELKTVKSHIAAMANKHKWLRYIRYDDKLSHWQAKNVGVAKSTGQFLWFVDAHVVLGRGASGMFKYYRNNYEKLNGTIHLPWTYHILESQRLLYRMVVDEKKAIFHYSSKRYDKDFEDPFEVPVMTTCGMMMTRDIFNRLGGWPLELGIYGGGENFINYCSAVLGIKKWIWPFSTIHHLGDNRGYNWNYNNYHFNRAIAVYMHSGIDMAYKYIENNVVGGSRRKRIGALQLAADKLAKHRKMIERGEERYLYDWIAEWKQRQS
jgi:glycosyltransferase involved in cell wall biosynthesis